MPEVESGPADAGTEVALDVDADAPAPASRPARGRTRVTVAVLGAVLALPLVVAAIALRTPRWYPVLDLAMTELRLRDVGTSHTPLIGLPGRIGIFPEQGSHPGPLSFYALAPIYRLLGSSAWAMLAGAVVLAAAGAVVCVLIAYRRGGPALALGVAAVLALLNRGYGIATLVEPWNPYLPLLWWMVTLLAVWSVVDDDLALLPVAVLAGSWCAQTHVPYLGLALGLGVLVTAVLVLRYRRLPAQSTGRRTLVRWAGISLALGVLVWIPPVIDQLVKDQGNFAMLWDHFTDPPQPLPPSPPEKPIGLAEGVDHELQHLDVTVFFARGDESLVEGLADHEGAKLRGGVVLLVWAASVLVAWQMRHRALLRLHLVVGVSLVLAVFSLSRIFGVVWFYLMLWSWGITALLVVAVGWTAAAAAARRLTPERRLRAQRASAFALAAVMVVTVAVFAVEGARADPPDPTLSRVLAGVIPPTAAALDAGEGAATGPDGRYLVTWSDAYYFGSQGYGIVSELERRGFDVGVRDPWRVPVTQHRVLDPAEATAVVHLATGIFIEDARAVPGAVEVAFIEPRSDAELAEYSQLRTEVIGELEAAGLAELVPLVDENLFGVSIDPRTPPDTEDKTTRMLFLGQETAMFIMPPDAAG